MKPFCFSTIMFLLCTPPVFCQPDDAVSRYDRRTGMQTEREADLKELGRIVYSATPADFIRQIEKLEAKWSKEDSSHYVSVTAVIVQSLIKMIPSNERAESLAREFAMKLMDRMCDAAPYVTDEPLQYLGVLKVAASQPPRFLADLVADEKSLSTALNLVQRVEEIVGQVNRAPGDTGIMLMRPKVPEKISTSAGLPAGPITDPILRAEYAGNVEAWEREYNTNRTYDHFGKGEGSRLEKLKREVATFVNHRFTSSAADLRTVRAALNRNITDAALKQQMVSLIYGVQNPFLGLPEGESSDGNVPSLEALTRKSAASGYSAVANDNSRSPAFSSSNPISNEATQSTSTRKLPYLPLAGVLACGLVVWWFVSRSRTS